MLFPADGHSYFNVEQELEPDKWNLIIMDTQEMRSDGIDKRISHYAIHTNDFSQWKWDDARISVKDPMRSSRMILPGCST